MNETKYRAPYEGFQGKVGKTFASSQSWWPERRRAPEGSPNVIVMIVDDMGYSDLGCYGSEIPTPHLDGLAAAGLRYTNFHVTPLCSPTRASLLTGCHSHSVGMGIVANADPGFPGYTGELPRNQPTMAEAFRDHGYATMAIGKWHLCREEDYHEASDKHSWPLQRGFDQYYGFLEALTNLHHPHRLYRDNSLSEVDQYPPGYYLTDDLTDQAMRMIRSCKAADARKPFFMYFAHGAVHAPLHAKPADMEKHAGRYAAGWDEIRRARFERQKQMGLMKSHVKLPPRNTETMEDVRAWEELGESEQRLFARYMETYAAMVDNLDQNMGRLLACLEELGELDNTCIVFISDNGGSREGMDRGTTSYFGRWNPTRSHSVEDDAVAADWARFDEIGGPTTWPHYPRGWAMASNTPFRLYKMTAHAGGHQVPCIVSWPRRLKKRAGELREQYVHVTDLLPTFSELIGLTVPDSRDGTPAVPRIGSSFAATLDDPRAPATHRENLIEVTGHRSFYRDGWEISTFHEARSAYGDHEWQLYHVAEDPTQTVDLARQMPEKVKELSAAWNDYAWKYQVFPLSEGMGLNRLIRPPEYDRLAEPVTLSPAQPTLERLRSAKLIQDRSFRIVVTFAAPGAGPRDEGVVVAHGGQESGYVIYVESGRLVYEQNVDGKMRRIDATLPQRMQELVVSVEAVAPRTWTVSMSADGKPLCRGEGFLRFIGWLPFEGIDVGIDRRSPVSWALYQRHGCFPYTGSIRSVRYEPGELCAEASRLQLEELRRQALRYE